MAWMTAKQMDEMHRLAVDTLKSGGRFVSVCVRGQRRHQLETIDGARVPGVGDASFERIRNSMPLASRFDGDCGRLVWELTP